MSTAPRTTLRPAHRPATRFERFHLLTHLLAHLFTHLLTRFIRYLCEGVVRTPQATAFQEVTSRQAVYPEPEMLGNVHVLVTRAAGNMPSSDGTCICTRDQNHLVTMCQFVSMFAK